MKVASINRSSLGAVLTFTLVLLCGCGASKKREAGIQLLQKTRASVHGLGILVSAGVTKQEYSQRLEDVLLNVGDINETQKQTIADFPHKEQPTVEAAYSHISVSLEAYEKARDYFGDDFTSFECQKGCSFFPENQYDQIKQQFPTIEPLAFGPENTWYSDSSGHVVYRSYLRSDMLRALWQLAQNEDATAGTIIEQITKD